MDYSDSLAFIDFLDFLGFLDGQLGGSLDEHVSGSVGGSEKSL